MNTQTWQADAKQIAASGHDINAAIAFFKRHGMQLARHPRNGWQVIAVLDTGRPNDAAFWHRIIGSADALIDLLDTPSALLAEKAHRERQATS